MARLYRVTIFAQLLNGAFQTMKTNRIPIHFTHKPESDGMRTIVLIKTEYKLNNKKQQHYKVNRRLHQFYCTFQ